MPVRTGQVTEVPCRWKDVQLQLTTKDIIRRVTAALSQVSNPFQNVGQKEGVYVWRVTKHRAVHWPTELYGHFYEKDVFVVLKTSLSRGSRISAKHTLHIWCGKGSPEVDYAAGCYIVSMLDEMTGSDATVHREIQGKETDEFLDIFAPYTTLWRGSSDTNYFSARGVAYQAKLLRWYHPDKRKTAVRVKEVAPEKENLISEDILLLDLGEHFYIWVGRDSSSEELLEATRYIETLNANRGGTKRIELINEGVSPDHFFYFYLHDSMSGTSHLVDSDDETAEKVSRNNGTLSHFKPSLSKASISGDKCVFKLLKEGKIEQKDYTGHPVTVFDSGYHCFVCYDSGAQKTMKKLGLQFGHEYLRSTKRPLRPLSCLKQGEYTVRNTTLENVSSGGTNGH